MKKYFIILIFLFFYSCYENNRNVENFNNVKDSIDYYFNKVDNSDLSNSQKSIFNLKAYRLIKRIKNDSIRFKYTFKSAARFYNLKSLPQYKTLSLDVISDAIKVKDTLIEAKGYIYLGDYHLMKNYYDSAFYYYDKAEIKYVSVGSTTKINEARINKATIQYFKKDYIGCETTILRALPIITKEGNVELLYNSLNTLGLCRIETQEFEEALEYFKKSLKYVDQLIDKSGANEMSLNNIGYTYLMMKQYKKANFYFEKVLNDFTKDNFIKTFASAKLNYTYSKFYLGEKENYERDLYEIISLFEKLNISTVNPKIYLSEFYESKNEIAKAQELAIQAYQVSVNEDLYRDKLLAIKQLANVFPDKAKFYSSEYIKLSDSIVAVDKKIQNTFARIEYRVDELNNENELLAQHNKQIIYYILIGILLFALGFVYFWQKQKQKQLLFENNQQKSNEQIYQLMLDQQVKYEEGRTIEKQRIAKELHDGVMNKLAAVRFNLYALKKDRTDKTIENCFTHIDEIQTIEKEIRTLSHDLSKEVFEKSNNFEAIIQAIYWNNDEDATNISYHFDPKIKWETISAEAKLNCYRIIQESVINCLKYAQAKNCSVSLTLEDTILVIKISDDGIGFDTHKVKSGIGLKNIAERVALLKGKFKILATPNQGTTLFINVTIENITV